MSNVRPRSRVSQALFRLLRAVGVAARTAVKQPLRCHAPHDPVALLGEAMAVAIWQGRATIPLPVVALRPLSLRCPPRCRHHTSLMGVIFTLDAVEGVGFLREHTARVAIFLSTVFFFRGESAWPLHVAWLW